MVRVRGLTPHVKSKATHTGHRKKAPPAKVAPEKDEELVADDDGMMVHGLRSRRSTSC